MARATSVPATRKRRKKTLKLAKGYYGSKHSLYRVAKQQVMKSHMYAYRDRKQKKRNFRRLWITRINAAARINGLSYSKFMHGLTLANIDLDRKVLADLAVRDESAFATLVEQAKSAMNNQ